MKGLVWLIPLFLSGGTDLPGGQTLSPAAFTTWIGERREGQRSFLLVDVRTKEQHALGVLPGTDTLIPLESLSSARDLAAETLVVYSQRGERAREAVDLLRELGYRWVFVGPDVETWVQRGGPLLRPSRAETTGPEGMVTDGIVPASRVCMTQDDVYPRDLIPVEVNGETYYGCCPGCAAAIQANPDRFVWAVDPVSGRKVNKARALIYSYRGKAYYFESRETLETFRKDPSRYLQPVKEGP